MSDRVDWLRNQLLDTPHIQEMVAKTMRRLGVATITQMAEVAPDDFESLCDAIEVMEEEMPEPGFPFPT